MSEKIKKVFLLFSRDGNKAKEAAPEARKENPGMNIMVRASNAFSRDSELEPVNGVVLLDPAPLVASRYAAEGVDVIEQYDEEEDDKSLHGSNSFPNSVEISEGNEIPLGDLVGAAFEKTGLTIDEWNAQSDEEIDTLLNCALESIREAETKKIEADNKEQKAKEIGQRVGSLDKPSVIGELTELSVDFDKSAGVRDLRKVLASTLMNQKDEGGAGDNGSGS